MIMITEKSIKALRPHPFNVAVYGQESVDNELLRSIGENGILVPLTVKKDGTIISGHRRFMAAKEAGLKRLPVVISAFSDELEEKQSIIEHNRQRQKTLTQLMREAEELESIEKARAKERQGTRYDLKQNIVSTLPQSSERGKTRDKVAKAIGMKPSTYRKARSVYEQARSGDEIATKALAAIDSGELTINAGYLEIKRHEKLEERRIDLHSQQESISSSENKNPDGQFEVIVIDPPWDYVGNKYDPKGRRVASPYPSMNQDELMALQIPSAKDCVLFLWTTHTFLFDAKELIDQWGFTYKATIVWDKEKLGVGSWLRMQCEFCLMAVKGKPLIINTKHRDIIRESKREHSRKPEAFYRLVEQITTGRRLDYFSRQQRKGWHSYGNDVDKFSADKK